jgi:hypothetical protein
MQSKMFCWDKNFILFLSVFCFIGNNEVFSQAPNFPTDNFSYDLIQDIEITNGFLNKFTHTSIKPFSRNIIFDLINDSFVYKSKSNYIKNSAVYLAKENSIWNNNFLYDKNLKGLYRNQFNFYSYKDSVYTLIVNPILNFGLGQNIGNGNLANYNTRGVEVSGKLYKNISFYSYITDNIVFPTEFVKDYVNLNLVYPTANLTKFSPDGSYNFLQARAYLSYSPFKQLNVQFGHDRNFIGDGYRSFILSDFGREFLFTKVRLSASKVNFMFLGGQMINQFGNNWQIQAEKKYLATHHLSINISKKFNLNFFETVVFSRTDSSGFNSGYDFSYANPLVFFRAVEHGLNSTDNAMIGLSFKYIPIKKILVYGQLVIDEFILEELFSNSGWYGNKYAVQLGIKVINPIKLDGLTLRLECNLARPYTFMHFNRAQSFVHNNIPVGHPLGANFKELIFLIKYQYNKKLILNINSMYYIKGYDFDNKNFGGDIANKQYSTAVKQYGNYIGQGNLVDVKFIELSFNYMFYNNLFLDVSYINRGSFESRSNTSTSNSYFSIGIRYNISRSNFLLI